MRLVYNCDFYRELERDKNGTENCERAFTKIAMSHRAIVSILKFYISLKDCRDIMAFHAPMLYLNR